MCYASYAQTQMLGLCPHDVNLCHVPCTWSPVPVFFRTKTGWWLTYPSEKWWSSSVAIMKIPNIWKIKNCSKPLTSAVFRLWNGVQSVDVSAMFTVKTKCVTLRVFNSMASKMRKHVEHVSIEIGSNMPSSLKISKTCVIIVWFCWYDNSGSAGKTNESCKKKWRFPKIGVLLIHPL